MPNSGPNGEWFTTTPEYWALVGARPILAIEIWYSDASCVRGIGDDMVNVWDASPREGVQVIIAHHGGDQRSLIRGRDEYTFPGAESTKLGLLIEREEFVRINKLAIDNNWRVI